jgi:hypothetical protein
MTMTAPGAGRGLGPESTTPLRGQGRTQAGRDAEPRAALLDSPSVKTPGKAGL